MLLWTPWRLRCFNDTTEKHLQIKDRFATPLTPRWPHVDPGGGPPSVNFLSPLSWDAFPVGPSEQQLARRFWLISRELETRLCVSERRWRDHSNRMWCGAVHLCVCAQERGREAHWVSHAYLYEGCSKESCPSDSAFNGSWPCKTGSKGNLDWYAASFQCHLCVC